MGPAKALATVEEVSVQSMGKGKGLTIPRLASDGTNWITWKQQTLMTLLSNKGVQRHIEGTIRQPKPVPTFPSGHVLTDQELESLEALEEKWDVFNQREAMIKAQILTTIPESLAIEIQSLVTGKDIWDALCKKHESKALTVTVDLRRRLYALKCLDDDNVREHVHTLNAMYENLKGMGEWISDADFTTVILGSLPKSYRPLINTISLQSRATPTAVSPQIVMETILEEFDRVQIEETQSKEAENAMMAKGGKGKGKKRKQQGQQSGKANPDVECWNCGKKGHYKSDCWGKTEQKGGRRKKQGGEAHISHSQEDYAFTLGAPGETGAYISNVNQTMIFDSGASTHMSPNRSGFVDFKSIEPKSVKAADKTIFMATGVGRMKITIPNGKTTTTVTLKDVLYCQDLGYTLVSLGKCDAAGFTIVLKDRSCHIKSTNGQTIGQIPQYQGLYRVDMDDTASIAALAATRVYTLDQLHQKMGHISSNAIKILIEKNIVLGLNWDGKSEPSFCTVCAKAKPTRKPIPKERADFEARALGDKIHSDVWGPATPQSYNGKRYYVSFTDDYTRWTVIYCISQKSEVFGKYKEFEAWLNTQHDKKIKIFQSDRGGEFTSKEFSTYIASRGTLQQFTVHDTPEENGVAERLNRTLLEHARAMLLAAQLPRNLWPETIHHAVWLKNRTSTRALNGMTPYEKMFKTKPNLSDLPDWGARVFVMKQNAGKLERKATEGRWVGYSGQSKGHRIYAPNRRISVERNVTFDNSRLTIPNHIPFVGEDKEDSVNSPVNRNVIRNATEKQDSPEESLPDRNPEPEETLQEKIVQDIERTPGTITPRRSARLNLIQDPNPIEPRRSDRIRSLNQSANMTQSTDEEIYFAMASVVHDIIDPPSVEAAKKQEDWEEWDKSIRAELDVHKNLGTGELVTAPPNANIVGSRIVLHYKLGKDGSISSRKARLVAQGFTQREGVDFTETFSPTAKLTAIRIIAAIAARNDWELEQTDVDAAYLNATLKDRIYMRQPKGYETSGHEDKVILLKRAIYGLRQSGREWYDDLMDTLTKAGFRRCKVEHAVFTRFDSDAVILAVDVDDITIAGNSRRAVKRFKHELASRYGIKDMGNLQWLLGIEVERDRENRVITFSQSAYIQKVVQRFGLEDAKPLSVPILPGHNLTKSQSPTTEREAEEMRHVPYREAIGSLMYAVVGTRPDIAYAVSYLARFMTNPGHLHWEAVKRIIRYLKGTHQAKLTIGKEQMLPWEEPGRHTPPYIVGYSDADGNSQEHRHAISGYAFCMGGGAISWSSRKQSLISLSTTESEYVSVTHAAKEALWIRTFLGEILAHMKAPMTLYCDNQSAIAVAKNDQYHARTKHIDIRYHFIREVITNGTIELRYCPTQQMAADIFTKALQVKTFERLRELLGICMN
jgi:hypothetical protein